MTKRSAIVIAAGLVAALMAGMVGATRQMTSGHAQVIVRTVAASGAQAAPAVPFGDDAGERG